MPKKSIKNKKTKKSRKYKTLKRKHTRRGIRTLSTRRRGGDSQPFRERQISQQLGQRQPQPNNPLLMLQSVPIITQESSPEQVYILMQRMIELWNFVVMTNLDENTLGEIRTYIDDVYENKVRVVSLHTGQVDDVLPEIMNERSSAILSDLFEFVAELDTTNNTVVIPTLNSYNNVPNQIHPDFEPANERDSNDEMDVSQ